MQSAPSDPPATPRIYMAGPLGFSEAGRSFHYSVLVPLVRECGFEELDPWTDPGVPRTRIQHALAMPYGAARRDEWRILNRAIGANNVGLIRQCHGVLAVLDGTDVDSGTAAEIGFAAAHHKPILGYRGDFRLSADNDGSIVNLQVEYFIHATLGSIVTTIAELREPLLAMAEAIRHPKRPEATLLPSRE